MAALAVPTVTSRRPGGMASLGEQPSGRIGAFSFVHNDQFYVCLGVDHIYPQVLILLPVSHKTRGEQWEGNPLLPVQRYDFSSAQWSGRTPVCVDHELEEHSHWFRANYSSYVIGATGACCAVLGDCAYVYGGYWKYGYAVHELNLETMVWRRLEPRNKEGPMRKGGAGMVACGDEALCVLGGYGRDTVRRQPGATYHMETCYNAIYYFTNELHLFHIGTGTWSSPETTGPRPLPCTEFSFTKVDVSRAVLFGGKGLNDQILNEVHILDLENWHWSGTILPSGPADLWPRGRHLHSACALFDPTPSYAPGGSPKEIPHSPSSDMSTGQHNPKLFVLWGEGNLAIDDAWILDVNSITWKQVKLPPAAGKPRRNFSFGCHYRSPTEVEFVVFGGSQGRFSDLVADTTLFYKGMKTLYHSCVDYVAETYELYQPLLQQLLPPHIHTDISRERDKRANYRVAQL